MSNKVPDNTIIMGIDPGTNITGFGVIRIKNNQMKLVDLIEFKLSKKNDHSAKLSEIFNKTSELIKLHNPNFVAIESPFFGKNVQSMLKLGRAQGVSMAAALNLDIPITEYSPKKIKMAITGNGNSSKEQVAKMLQKILQANHFVFSSPDYHHLQHLRQLKNLMQVLKNFHPLKFCLLKKLFDLQISLKFA